MEIVLAFVGILLFIGGLADRYGGIIAALLMLIGAAVTLAAVWYGVVYGVLWFLWK